jgi:hypothetical protein
VYTLWDQTQHCDHNIFYATANGHFAAQPVWALKNWLHVYRPLVIHSIKEATRHAIRLSLRISPRWEAPN